METQTNHPESHPSLRDTYRMLADAGFGLIRVVANDKRPEGTWAEQSGTAWLTADEAITRLESRTGNVGIVPRDDYIVIDFDGDDPIERFNRECKKSSEFQTFAVRTPNGFHVYCRVNDPELIEVTTGKTNWGKGVDIRSARANSQVVGPGSHVESTKPGKRSGDYEVVCHAPIAYAPENIELLCRKDDLKLNLRHRAQSANQSPPQDDGDEQTKPSLKTCRNKVSEARRHIRQLHTGNRNDGISKYASMAGSYGCHHPEKIDYESLHSQLAEDVESILTDDDSEDERARHFDTLDRQLQYGWDNPHYVNGSEGSGNDSSNAPARFRRIFDELGCQARYNLEKGANEYSMPDRNDWSDLKALELDQLFASIWDRYGWNISQQNRRLLLAYVCMQNPVRPVRERLEACKVNPDLSHITLENWLSPWLDNPDGALEQWASKAILVGIVYRIMDGDKPQRIHCILRGPGNSGKSTLVQNLLFPEFDITGDLNLNASDREIISQLANNFVVEWSEIRANFMKDVGKAKSFLGAGKKSLRKLYFDSAVTNRKYTATVIGTTNPGRVLADDDALISRIVFVPVHRNDEFDPAIKIPEIREHIFALALQAYHEGFEPNILPGELVADQSAYAEPSVNRDSRFEDGFGLIAWNLVPTEFRTQEIAGYMGMARNPKDYARNKELMYGIEKLLIEKGFTFTKGYSGYSYWRRPDDSGDMYPLPNEDISKRKGDVRTRRAAAAYDRINYPNPFSNPEPKNINLDDLESGTQPHVGAQ